MGTVRRLEIEENDQWGTFTSLKGEAQRGKAAVKTGSNNTLSLGIQWVRYASLSLTATNWQLPAFASQAVETPLLPLFDSLGLSERSAKRVGNGTPRSQLTGIGFLTTRRSPARQMLPPAYCSLWVQVLQSSTPVPRDAPIPTALAHKRTDCVARSLTSHPEDCRWSAILFPQCLRSRVGRQDEYAQRRRRRRSAQRPRQRVPEAH